MTEKILFVDDEVQILNSMKRQLRKRFEVVTAQSGREALEKLKLEGPFSIIVSDMRMPEMNGVELLLRVKDLYPDTVRLMLTGNADQATAIEAVNKGQIFRFLNKPCSIPLLVTSLALAQRQYRLVTAERQLLDETLKGSVKILSELLSFANPAAFSAGTRIRPLVAALGKAFGLTHVWQLEIGALLSQIGCVTLPGDIIDKLYSTRNLDPEENEMYCSHPGSGARLLENIPRMKGVADIIRNQMKSFSEFDSEKNDDEETDIGAQILKVAFDYDLMRCQGNDHGSAVAHLQQSTQYNRAVIRKLATLKNLQEVKQTTSLMLKDITVGMVTGEDIISTSGTLIAPKGQEITLPVLQGLKNFAKKTGIIEPIKVKIMGHDVVTETDCEPP